MPQRDVTVLVVDDQPLVREGVAAVLGRERGLRVVGQAPDGRTAVRLVAQLRPRVILMDLEMPELNGIDASRRILRAHPGARIVGLSGIADATRVTAALAAGIVGYLVKTCEPGEVVRAIRAAAEGQGYLSPEVAALVADGYASRAGAAAGEDPPTLTRREREVLQLVAEGRSTKQIARALGVSPKTVESHRYTIARRLRLHSIAELTKYAVRHGLTALEA